MSWNVLIVDDHEVARVGVSWLLNSPPFNVAGSVPTSAKALECLEEKSIDLVLLDIRLSDGSGLKLLEQIRKLHADIPVVVFSAYENPTYIARAAALGAAVLRRDRCGTAVRDQRRGHHRDRGRRLPRLPDPGRGA